MPALLMSTSIAPNSRRARSSSASRSRPWVTSQGVTNTRVPAARSSAANASSLSAERAASTSRAPAAARARAMTAPSPWEAPVRITTLSLIGFIPDRVPLKRNAPGGGAFLLLQCQGAGPELLASLGDGMQRPRQSREVLRQVADVVFGEAGSHALHDRVGAGA